MGKARRRKQTAGDGSSPDSTVSPAEGRNGSGQRADADRSQDREDSNHGSSRSSSHNDSSAPGVGRPGRPSAAAAPAGPNPSTQSQPNGHRQPIPPPGPKSASAAKKQQPRSNGVTVVGADPSAAAAAPAAAGHSSHGGGQHCDHSHGRRQWWRRKRTQWLLAGGAVLLAIAAMPMLIEDGPSTVSELLQDGLGGLSRLNVSMPQLPQLPALSLQLQLPSLDALIAAAALRSGGGGNAGAAGGFSLSYLLGLTDSLTDTLAGTFNDLTDTLTDTFASGRASLNLSLSASVSGQLRALLSQLPAFSLPGVGVGGGSGNASAEEAGLRPGLAMARRGYKAKHPVVIVPGFVTSGLELWRGLPCGQRYFRQRMWGTLAMVQAFLTDPGCWFRHMELDPVTGLDPEGIKIRAAGGLEAVDYFIQGYWVWGKLVEALADVGYDSNSLVSMPYDWRLAMPLLEERDGYFTRLRSTVESLVEVGGERVVITAHSYGENVVRGFMQWVEADRPGWVEAHVASVINIAGTTLGVPKSVSALLSGETRDTAQLGALAGFLTSNLVPRATRTRVWRTWGASYAMLPVGGTRVWGNASWAPDDTPEMRAAKRTYGAMASLWPHNWQAVLAEAAAAAAVPPPQRERLQELVANVSQRADEDDDGDAAGGGGGGGAAAAAAEAAGAGPGGGASGTEGGQSGNGGGDGGSTAGSNVDSSSSSTGGGGAGGGDSSNSSGGAASGGGGLNPVSLLAEKLKRLVGSGGGGGEVDPAEHLHSKHVSRLDVSGFLSLLREVGGPLVGRHMAEWGAVAPRAGGKREQEEEGEEVQASEQEAAALARQRELAAAESGGALAEQALGGRERLRRAASGSPSPASCSSSSSSCSSSYVPSSSSPAPSSSSSYSSSPEESSANGGGGGRRQRRVALFPDATRVPLPPAPSTTLVCLYGVGLPTERAYHYLRPPPPTAAAGAAAAPAAETPAAAAPAGGAGSGAGKEAEDEAAAAKGEPSNSPGDSSGGDGGGGNATSGGGADGGGADGGEPKPPPHSAAASGEEADVDAGPEAAAGWMIMRDVSQPEHALDVGVALSDGDGTVPLLSLGLMCRGGWRPGGRLNPGGMRVVTREFKHRSVSLLQDARGGPGTAAHVDILGNEGVLADVVRVAAGRAAELADLIVTDIDAIAAAVDFDKL